ncbi:MAG: GNAT family N-acetyltransferase [Clostridiaceae bacterium]
MEVKAVRDIKHSRIALVDENGKEVGKVMVSVEYGIVTLNHTQLDPSLQGTGLGIKLIDEAVAYAKENNYKINSKCPYGKKMLLRNQERYGVDVMAQPLDETDDFF